MNKPRYLRRVAKTICFAVGTILLLLSAPKYAQAAETQEIQVKTALTAKVEDENSRSFAVTQKLWSEMTAFSAAEPSAAVLVLDISPAMLQLAQVPEGKGYFPDVLYESIDENRQLYTLADGNYCPIFRKDNNWYIAQWDKEGNCLAAGGSIGTRLTGEEAGDRFTVRVYEKGEAKTRLEYQQAAALRYIHEMAAVSPKCKIALVYCNAEVTAKVPLFLTEENVKRLEENLSACEELVKEGNDGLSALKAAVYIAAEYKQQGFSAPSVVFVGGSPCTEPDSAQERLGKAAEITNGLRENGTEIYAVNLLPEDTEAVKLLTAMATNPQEGGYLEASAEMLPEILHGFLAKTVNAPEVTAVLALDPRFTLPEAQKKTLTAAGAKVEADEEGALQIRWQVTLPVLADSPWEATFTIKAKEDFFGGNDIAFEGDETGVYLQKDKLADFQCPKLNVPVKLALKDLDITVFLGQKLPARVEEKLLEEAMGFFREPKWYGKEETGAFTVEWKTEGGEKIGETKQLQKISPANEDVYLLCVTYEPNTSGLASIGKANPRSSKTARLLVQVVSGKIRIKLNLRDKELEAIGGTYLFKLTNGAEVRYTAVDLHNRNEDGEGIVLEAAFENLPFGTYTLTQEYFYTSETGMYKEEGEIGQCKVGFANDSDKIDLENTELVLYPIPYTGSGEISKKTRSTQVKINGYQIEWDERNEKGG